MTNSGDGPETGRKNGALVDSNSEMSARAKNLKVPTTPIS